MFSAHAIRCGNCRCEYDNRSFQNCPSCGQSLHETHQQQASYGAQMQQRQMQQNWESTYGAGQAQNTLSNQMNGGIGGQLGSGLAGLGAAQQQLAKAQFKPNVHDDRVPELIEYENRVKGIKVNLPAFKETKMFGLWKQRTELRIEIERLAKDLEHHRKNEEMRIAEAVQKQRLFSNEELAKAKIAADKQIADANNRNELTLTTLQGKFTRDKAEQDAKYAKDLAEAKTKAAEDYYEKMTKAMTELHQNGDKNSKFIQELALTMVQKTPKLLPGQARVRIKGTMKDIE